MHIYILQSHTVMSFLLTFQHAVYLKPSYFRDVKRPRLVVGNRCFRTTCSIHLQGSSSQEYIYVFTFIACILILPKFIIHCAFVGE